jgi:hypothetical protein
MTEDMKWLKGPPSDLLSATATKEFTRLMRNFHNSGPDVLANVVLEAIDEWGSVFGHALIERIQQHLDWKRRNP